MTTVTTSTRPAAGAGLGAIGGVLACGLALGIGQLIAGFTGPVGSPVVAVGELSIDSAPPPVKNFAISAFGSHDKLVLVSGILVVLAIFAAVIGTLAMRRLAYGLAGVAVFALIGEIAVISRPTSTAVDVLPTVVGGIVAAAALVFLVQAASAARDRSGQRAPDAADDSVATTFRRPAAANQAQAGRAGQAGAAGAAEPAGTAGRAGGSGPAGGGRPLPGGPEPGGEPPRRRFLAISAGVAGAAAVSGVAGRLLAERENVSIAQRALQIPAKRQSAPPLPAGANLRIPGVSPFITPNSAFYRVDTAIVLPEIPPSSWHLRIHGMVRREIVLSFDELIRRPLHENYITLCCVSNPVGGPYIGNALWVGVSLRDLLRQAGIRAGADQLFCTSVDGFTSGSPVQTAMDGRDAMLAFAMNGTALPVAHGFPVRMVVPGLYGYVSACKWITDIEVTTYQANVAYWAARGWSPQATIKTESRIDVPNGQNSLKPGVTPVAGVAWAQHRGVEAVEVRVDRGPWQQARLAQVPDIDTWRQWVWDWHATPGNHVIEARATDKTGYTQTAVQAPPEPNGATGYPAVQVSVSS
jgi:DMSO/TMAO reductase YedYZ molybdopterin-dependent catalytic subunit